MTVRLRTALTPLRQHAALIDGSVGVPGVELDHVEVPRHAEIFRRMGRNLEFDVCEFSAVSYLLAREHGLPIRAVPIVPRHGFHHGDFVINRRSGVETPKDLEGRRVATRSYTLTPGVLDRGLLSDEFGVDLSSITWRVANDEHIRESQSHLPGNVTIEPGADLFALLAQGKVDAGIAGTNVRGEVSPDVVKLFPDATSLDRAEYARTGVVPIFSIIAVHERACADRPWLMAALYEAFLAARIDGGVDVSPTVTAVDPDDPSPQGLMANEAGWEQLVRLAREQSIITQPFTVGDLFPDFV